MLVIQGDKDLLVDPDNADYAKRMLNPATSRVIRNPEFGHLFPLDRPKLVADCIIALADRQLERCG